MRSNIGVQDKQTYLYFTPSMRCHMDDCKSSYTNLITNQVKRSKVGLRIRRFLYIRFDYLGLLLWIRSLTYLRLVSEMISFKNTFLGNCC